MYMFIINVIAMALVIHFHHKQMFIFVIISYVDCVYFVWLELEIINCPVNA